jgi:hypothetical protein
VPLELGEGLGLRLGVRERLRLLVVPVRLKVGDRLFARPVRSLTAVLALHGLRGAVEVVGRVVGSQVRAVAEDRAVLHQAVVEEDPLSVADVLALEQRLPGRIDDAIGDRRVGAVGAIREQAEDEEADQEDDDRGLDPGPGDRQLPSLCPLRHCRGAILLPPARRRRGRWVRFKPLFVVLSPTRPP